jgi:hypothetical protein
MDQRTLKSAIQYLIDGGEADAADVLRTCEFEDWNVVDTYLDGSRRLEGVLVEIKCPRATYEILTDQSNPITERIRIAVEAVMPADMYLKQLCPRAVPRPLAISDAQRESLIEAIELQKGLMIAVATGGPRIQQKNSEYVERRREIRSLLSKIGVPDPNSYSDLWAWYGKWSDGSLPTYQSRRRFIGDLYQPLLNALQLVPATQLITPVEATGWARVDRGIDAIRQCLESATNEEDYQTVGLHCREALISVAQAVYDPSIHKPVDGVKPSNTDAARMLEAFIATHLAGKSNEAVRRHAKAVLQLAVELQHKRTAQFRDAALCAEATCSVVNLVAIIDGRRDP